MLPVSGPGWQGDAPAGARALQGSEIKLRNTCVHPCLDCPRNPARWHPGLHHQAPLSLLTEAAIQIEAPERFLSSSHPPDPAHPTRPALGLLHPTAQQALLAPLWCPLLSAWPLSTFPRQAVPQSPRSHCFPSTPVIPHQPPSLISDSSTVTAGCNAQGEENSYSNIQTIPLTYG